MFRSELLQVSLPASLPRELLHREDQGGNTVLKLDKFKESKYNDSNFLFHRFPLSPFSSWIILHTVKGKDSDLSTRALHEGRRIFGFSFGFTHPHLDLFDKWERHLRAKDGILSLRSISGLSKCGFFHSSKNFIFINDLGFQVFIFNSEKLVHRQVNHFPVFSPTARVRFKCPNSRIAFDDPTLG